MPNIGTTEIIIVFVIILLLFGGTKLRELAKGLGESTKEIKKVKRELTGDEKEAKKERNEAEDM